MAAVTVQSVSKAFGALKALHDVSIAFDDGGFYGLLGPSGSGKTTLLRMIAGFDFPDSGSIAIGGQPVERLPVEKREIGMMFQNYALFPNMTVFDNVAFGLSVRSVPEGEIRQRVGEVLDLVRLTGLDGRKPHQLSGGQRQRVALARAIVTRPRVLLLDEPLSALDKALRVDMQVELKRIQSEVAITTIFVTHDQEEALTLSDRVGILKDGALVQEGEPQALYERPESEFAAKFLGDANILSGTLADGRVTLADGTKIVCGNAAAVAPGAVRIAVRPEKIAFDNNSAENRLTAQVIQRIFAGSSITYLLDWQGETLKVFAQNSGGSVIKEGQTVTLTWSARDSVIVS